MTDTGLTLTGLPRDEPVTLPDVEDFLGDYLIAPEIGEIADAVIGHYERFAWLQSRMLDIRIRYLWQKTGGKNSGGAILGWCSKASGITRFIANVDIVIGIAWDQAKAHKWTNLELEALIFHELCHIGYEINAKGEFKIKLAGHDQEMFNDEVRLYGFWKPSLTSTAMAFQQALLAWDPETSRKPEETVAPSQPLDVEAVRAEETADAAPRSEPISINRADRSRRSLKVNGETLVWNEESGAYYGAETGERFEGPLASQMHAAATEAIKRSLHAR